MILRDFKGFKDISLVLGEYFRLFGQCAMFNCRKCQQKQLDFRVTERKFLLQRFCFTALVAA